MQIIQPVNMQKPLPLLTELIIRHPVSRDLKIKIINIFDLRPPQSVSITLTSHEVYFVYLTIDFQTVPTHEPFG